jgi:hypothetical protein
MWLPRAAFWEMNPETGSDQGQALPFLVRAQYECCLDEEAMLCAQTPPCSLERVCRVGTDVISLAPKALRNLTGSFLLPMTRNQHQPGEAGA